MATVPTGRSNRENRGGAGAVGRAEALRYNALAAECAGVLVDDRAVGFVVGIEGNARRRGAQQPRQNLFSRRKRPPAQILAVKFDVIPSCRSPRAPVKRRSVARSAAPAVAHADAHSSPEAPSTAIFAT